VREKERRENRRKEETATGEEYINTHCLIEPEMTMERTEEVEGSRLKEARLGEKTSDL
jgi:hypothetical protein